MVEITCKCGYTWNTTSKLAFTTCPSCLGKVKVTSQKTIVDEDEHKAVSNLGKRI